jgi:hypothetical protein
VGLEFGGCEHASWSIRCVAAASGAGDGRGRRGARRGVDVALAGAGRTARFLA